MSKAQHLVGTNVSFIVRDSNTEIIPGFDGEPPVMRISVMDSYACLEDAVSEPSRIVRGIVQLHEPVTRDLMVVVPQPDGLDPTIFYVEQNACLEVGTYQPEALA